MKKIYIQFIYCSRDKANQDRDKLAAKLIVLEKKIMDQGLTEDDLLAIYAKTLVVGGRKARKWEVQSLDDLDEDDKDALLLRALRRKILRVRPHKRLRDS